MERKTSGCRCSPGRLCPVAAARTGRKQTTGVCVRLKESERERDIEREIERERERERERESRRVQALLALCVCVHQALLAHELREATYELPLRMTPPPLLHTSNFYIYTYI